MTVITQFAAAALIIIAWARYLIADKVIAVGPGHGHREGVVTQGDACCICVMRIRPGDLRQKTGVNMSVLEVVLFTKEKMNAVVCHTAIRVDTEIIFDGLPAAGNAQICRDMHHIRAVFGGVDPNPEPGNLERPVVDAEYIFV